MALTINDKVTFSNGVAIPQFGFGTFKIVNQDDMSRSIKTAIQAGYRAFDTAQEYKNEHLVGAALKESNLQRDEYFLTTKVANAHQGYDSTLKTFEQSLQDLQVDFVDLFLVHWPLNENFFETWQAMEKLYEQKLTKAIGVCNFHISHLELLSTKANIKPMINQIEIHPYLTQDILIEYLKQENIAIQGWSPLARGKMSDEPVLTELGKKYHKTPSQIALRWHIQNGYITIPKSTTPTRIVENSQIFDFELTADEMKLITSLNQNFRSGRNPDDVYKHNGFNY